MENRKGSAESTTPTLPEVERTIAELLFCGRQLLTSERARLEELKKLRARLNGGHRPIDLCRFAPR